MPCDVHIEAIMQVGKPLLLHTATLQGRDILDDLLHQDSIGQHVCSEGSVLKQQAKQLAHHGQLLRPNPVHPQALQQQPEDSRQKSQDRDAGPHSLSLFLRCSASPFSRVSRK